MGTWGAACAAANATGHPRGPEPARDANENVNWDARVCPIGSHFPEIRRDLGQTRQAAAHSRFEADTASEPDFKLGRFDGFVTKSWGCRSHLILDVDHHLRRPGNRWKGPRKSPAVAGIRRNKGTPRPCGKTRATAVKHESLLRQRPIIRQHVARLQRRSGSCYGCALNRCRSQTSSSENAPNPAMLRETCAIAFSRLSLPRLLPASATMALLGR